MSNKARKAYFVDPRKTRALKELLGTRSEAEAIRQVVDEALESRKFWQLLKKQSGRLSRRDIAL